MLKKHSIPTTQHAVTYYQTLEEIPLALGLEKLKR